MAVSCMYTSARTTWLMMEQTCHPKPQQHNIAEENKARVNYHARRFTRSAGRTIFRRESPRVGRRSGMPYCKDSRLPKHSQTCLLCKESLRRVQKEPTHGAHYIYTNSVNREKKTAQDLLSILLKAAGQHPAATHAGVIRPQQRSATRVSSRLFSPLC